MFLEELERERQTFKSTHDRAVFEVGRDLDEGETQSREEGHGEDDGTWCDEPAVASALMEYRWRVTGELPPVPPPKPAPAATEEQEAAALLNETPIVSLRSKADLVRSIICAGGSETGTVHRRILTPPVPQSGVRYDATLFLLEKSAMHAPEPKSLKARTIVEHHVRREGQVMNTVDAVRRTPPLEHDTEDTVSVAPQPDVPNEANDREVEQTDADEPSIPKVIQTRTRPSPEPTPTKDRKKVLRKRTIRRSRTPTAGYGDRAKLKEVSVQQPAPAKQSEEAPSESQQQPPPKPEEPTSLEPETKNVPSETSTPNINRNLFEPQRGAAPVPAREVPRVEPFFPERPSWPTGTPTSFDDYVIIHSPLFNDRVEPTAEVIDDERMLLWEAERARLEAMEVQFEKARIRANLVGERLGGADGGVHPFAAAQNRGRAPQQQTPSAGETRRFSPVLAFPNRSFIVMDASNKGKEETAERQQPDRGGGGYRSPMAQNTDIPFEVMESDPQPLNFDDGPEQSIPQSVRPSSASPPQQTAVDGSHPHAANSDHDISAEEAFGSAENPHHILEPLSRVSSTSPKATQDAQTSAKPEAAHVFDTALEAMPRATPISLPNNQPVGRDDTLYGAVVNSRKTLADSLDNTRALYERLCQEAPPARAHTAPAMSMAGAQIPTPPIGGYGSQQDAAPAAHVLGGQNASKADSGSSWREALGLSPKPNEPASDDDTIPRVALPPQWSREALHGAIDRPTSLLSGTSQLKRSHNRGNNARVKWGDVTYTVIPKRSGSDNF